LKTRSIYVALAVLSGLPPAIPALAATWKIDMDEVVCRSDAIVVGAMDKPIEIQREPYRPQQDGTPAEKVTFASRLEVIQVLWGLPSLRDLNLVSGKIDPPAFILPGTLRSPGSSRPIDTEAIWYLQRISGTPSWKATYVTPLNPDRANATIDHVTKRISDNQICLQPVHVRIQRDGTVQIELQLELRNPTDGQIGFPGFEMRDLQAHSQVLVTLETSGQGVVEAKQYWGVVLDPSIPSSRLPPGSSRFFPVRSRAPIRTVGFGSSSRMRLKLGTFGTTNWTSPILR
jgi:hypothetical protein